MQVDFATPTPPEIALDRSLFVNYTPDEWTALPDKPRVDGIYAPQALALPIGLEPDLAWWVTGIEQGHDSVGLHARVVDRRYFRSRIPT